MTRLTIAAVLFGILSNWVWAREQTTAAAEPVTNCTAPSVYVPESKEAWTAGSTTAMSIPGDIEFSKDSIQFGNGVTARLRFIGRIEESTVAKYPVFLRVHCVALYEVDPPVTADMLSGNRICGFHKSTGEKAEPLLYLAAGISSDNWLELAAYSSGSEYILQSSIPGRLCGTYGFFRKKPQ